MGEKTKMAELSNRQRLKKNELEDLVITAVHWTKNNRMLFFSIAGIVLGAGILSFFFFTTYNEIKIRASDKLSMAQGSLSQGQTAQAIGMIDEVITKYPNTASAFQARLSKAEYLNSQKKYDEAQALVMPVIEGGNPKTIIPLALSILGTSQENAQKYKEAAETYNKFLDKYPDHFLAPKTYESLGRVYELINSPAEAKAVYEKLALLYPASAWSKRAQERITILSNKGSK